MKFSLIQKQKQRKSILRCSSNTNKTKKIKNNIYYSAFNLRYLKTTKKLINCKGKDK